MAWWNRKDTTPNKRAVEIGGQNGTSASGAFNFFDLTGTWNLPPIDGSAELARFRPNPAYAANTSAVAARCLDLISQSAASRKIEILNENGEQVPHVVANLFNSKPNPFQSGAQFRTSLWNRMTTQGQAFVILDRGPSRIDDPKTAVIHFGAVKVVIDDPTPQFPHGNILAYRAQIGKQWVTLAPSEVLWLRFPDPADPWAARAPITAALDAIGLSKAARIWQAGQLANGGTPAGVMYIGQPPTDEDYDIAREEIDAALTGPSAAGRIAVTAGPVEPKFIPMSLKAEEVAYIQTLQITGEEIALAMGVPLDLVGGQRTYANVDASWRIFWEGTILPRLSIIASEIDRQLLDDENLNADFNTEDISALQEAADALAIRIAKAVDSDILTLDEARAELGFDPMPNGEGTKTLSVYRADNAPQATTATPVGNPKRSSDTRSYKAYQIRGVDAVSADRHLTKLEEATKRAVARLAAAQKADAMKRLNRGKRDTIAPELGKVFNSALWLERAQEYLLPVISQALDTGASATAEALGVDVKIDSLIAMSADHRAKTLATQINETTASVLADRLSAAAIGDQLTISQFADVLDSTFEDLSTWRASTIARTEMVSCFNGASRLSAVDSGVTHARIWVAASDGHTRQSHRALDGTQTNGMDDAYPNGLMYPGDPNGDPEETVNCRCVEQYVTDFGNNNDGGDSNE